MNAEYICMYVCMYVCMCVCVCIHVAVCRPIGTKFGTHMQIHLEGKNYPCVTWGHLGGFKGSTIQKSGKTTKQLDRLGPNLAHMFGFIWE